MIDVAKIVEINLRPVITVDATIPDDIPVMIEAQWAMQGWIAPGDDDRQRAYISALTLEAFMPRILLLYADEIEGHIVAAESTKMPDRVKYLKALQTAIDKLKASASGIGPESKVNNQLLELNRWPGCGIASW